MADTETETKIENSQEQQHEQQKSTSNSISSENIENENETLKQQENNTTELVEDESYQIPPISFEDSQVDRFVPYSSPSVLNWETRKAINTSSFADENSQNQQNDISDIEKMRGNGDTSTSITQLTQMPIEEDENEHQTNEETLSECKTASNLENYESTLKTLANINLNGTNNSVVIQAVSDDLVFEGSSSISNTNNTNFNHELTKDIKLAVDEDKDSINISNPIEASKLIKMPSTSSESSTSYKQIANDVYKSSSNIENNKSNEFNLLTNVDNEIINENYENDNDDDDNDAGIVNVAPTAAGNNDDETTKNVNSASSNLLNLSFQSSTTSSSTKSSLAAVESVEPELKQQSSVETVNKTNENNKNEAIANVNVVDDSLSTSSSSCSQQSSTLDSLAKRVETLIGPVKLDPPSSKVTTNSMLPPQPPTSQSSLSAIANTSSSLYAQIVQNNGKLPPTLSTTKSKFDYSTIQKDLDTIQNNLKLQRPTLSTTKPIVSDSVATANKENKEPIAVAVNTSKVLTDFKTKKSSYLDFETPKTRLNEKPEPNYLAKIGRDLLHETPMRLSQYSSETLLNDPQKTALTSINNNKNSTLTSLATPNIQSTNLQQQKSQHQQLSHHYLSRLDTPSTNLSYNMLFGKVHNDYHSSTVLFEKATAADVNRFRSTNTALKLNEIQDANNDSATDVTNDDADDVVDDDVSDRDIVNFKKNASTSPIKFVSLLETRNSYIHETDVGLKYGLSKSPTRRSAFDDDPEVILSRAKKNMPKTTTTTTTTRLYNNSGVNNMRSLNVYDETSSADNTSLFSNSVYSQQQQQAQQFTAFDKVNMKLMTQLRDAASRSPTYNEYDSSFSKRQTAAAALVDLKLLKTNSTISTPPVIPTTNGAPSVITPNTVSTNSNSVLTTVTSTIPSAGGRNPSKLDASNTSGQSETYESTHTGSDDAHGPKLPSYVYGTRDDEPRGANGIYTKNIKKMVTVKEPQENLLIESNSMRKVDKDLKDLLKKKSTDANRKYDNVRKSTNAVAWDINLNDEPTNEHVIDEIPAPPPPPQQQQQPIQAVETNQQEQNVENKKLDSKSVQVIINNDKQINKKQQSLNSASTQTSFLVENSDIDSKNSKRLKKSHNQPHQQQQQGDESFDDKQKKLKIQALIRKQKQEHELRLKTLEKLAKLERLQAEKLKQIMLLNHNDTITSSIMADSYFQSDLTASLMTSDNETTVATEQADETNNNNQNDETLVDEKAANNKSAYVQVLNLKNTSVYEPPEGFRVIKENKKKDENTAVQVNNKSNLKQPKKQTNELHTDGDGRVFVSIPKSSISSGLSNNTTSNNNSLRNSKSASCLNTASAQQQQQQQHNSRQSAVWFQPVTLVSETTREPLMSNNRKQQIIREKLNTNSHSRSPVASHQEHYNHHHHQQQQQHRLRSPIRSQNTLIRDISFEQQDEIKQQQLQQPKGLKKLSLQEAFEMFNFNFISRSRKRLKEIKLRSEVRRHEEQFKRERIECGIDTNIDALKRRNIYTKHSLDHHPYSDNLFLAQRRHMTCEQIKQQTNKVYKNLPEVKERQKKVKYEEERKRNRIKSSVYNKTIQQRVLTKGPNFNLNFKALD